MIPQVTLKEKMLWHKIAGNIKKMQVKLLAIALSTVLTLNLSAQCPTDITVNNDPGVCTANVILPTQLPPSTCGGTTFGPELVTSGNFENGRIRWDDCGNSVEVHSGTFLTEYVYGGAINSTNHVAEIEYGDAPGRPHTLCQHISGFTVGATYRLTFLATRRIEFAPFLGPTPATVGTLVTIAGTETSVFRSNTTFEYTQETITFTATATTMTLTFVPLHPYPLPPFDPGYGLVVDDVSIKQFGPCTVTQSSQSGPFPVGTTPVTYTFDGGNGNISTCNFNVIVIDTETPTIICQQNISVNSDPGNAGTVVAYPTPVGNDNCTFTISQTAGLPSGSVFPVGLTTNTFVITDASGNTATCSFTVNVDNCQNPSNYIIYASKKVKFEEYNKINGSVGLRSITDKVKFKKHDELQDPYFVKAVNIEIDHPSSIDNLVYAQPNDGPVQTFYPYDGNTTGLSNYTVETNMTLAGNYKDLTVKKGISATLQGNNFGKIKIEEGAQVTFTGTNINMVSFEVLKGKAGVNTTNVYFANSAKVKISYKAKVEENSRVNVNGPDVTFYLGGGTGHDVDFEVNGNNTQVKANMMIPHGKLKTVGGYGPGVMTGWYLVEELYGAGKNITWNGVYCNTPTCTLPVFQVCPSNMGIHAAVGACNAVGDYMVVATSSIVPTLTYTLTGATTGSGTGTGSGLDFNLGTTQVTVTATNTCGTASCSFAVTVIDDNNGTGYIVYASKKIKFEEYNTINGNVGVTAVDGKAEFKKGDILDPFFVKAVEINKEQPAEINNEIPAAANDGPVATFSPYNGSTNGLINKEVSVNNTVLTGNWKDVTIKKNIQATFTGNNFGKIKVEEGASVTFTETVINMVELEVQKGKEGFSTTNVYFSNPAIVKINYKATIEENCRVNIDGPKVTFHMGTANSGADFNVKSSNTQVTGDMVIPRGKLKTEGSYNRPGIMTGLYLVEELYGSGKYITWNGNPCLNQPAPRPFAASKGTINNDKTIAEVTAEVAVKDDLFSVHVYPNPAVYDFSIMVNSKSNDLIVIRIIDWNGKVISEQRQFAKSNVIKVGSNLAGGIYIAEVTQGNSRKLVKLVKLN